MTAAPTAHDFLLHLRGRQPFLARRLDGVRGVAFGRETLEVRVPRGSWSERELTAHREDLLGAAQSFFGPPTQVRLEPCREEPEGLPFPVLASKQWNHVAFWVREGRLHGVLALRKPLYLETWLPLGGDGDGEVFRGRYGATGGVADLADDLCGLGRAQGSYVQLVTPFPGDREADRLEGALYGVKEWGTPRTPAAVLQKYLGRVHYVSPGEPPLGVRLARRWLDTPP